jgi:hypothetical protein
VPGPHPTQRIEHRFGSGSGTLRSPTGPLIAEVGPRWGRNSAESEGQQGTAGITDIEGQRPFGATDLGGETAGVSFHTAAATGSGLGCEGWTLATAKPVCGRQHQRPVWGTSRLLAAEFKPPVEGWADPTRWWVRGGPLPSTGA